ncbi:Myosin-1 [Wickerhamomyces ciferrii]|uniref:Myosin-1 n=1 Tax=Wickerhamomyces ciferrii (strain ATCC 14091 / BCRC 22168 / CBS 111 / JCM 3599 / NBRC 0793 / NRRL Y-1031 F-60-10) TaxID=1206466 RepID=K0KID3_WICCF|nr:Myosin-1 [Wickerhamomyces ciferrii]CCH40913.1 Myosin-1 [Wickerhamomyces ciferrii]
MSISTTKINPTYIGYIGSTKDALLIIQACLNNQLLTVPRRPHDRERSQLISSGNVFVFIEERSGIKRWTDGVAWSPSRILGRFLVYRELDRQALNSKEKSKYNDKKKSISSSSSSSIRKNSFDDSSINNNGSQSNSIANRSLVGSLVTSYAFKEYGLIKKTMSVTINRLDLSTQTHLTETIHLISYYSAEDVLNGKLTRPVDNNSSLSKIQLSNELWTAVKESSLGGKIPLEDEAFYFMDQSNPNAIALGFNPAIHLQPQYQQNRPSIQQQQQAIPQQIPSSSSTTTSTNTSQQQPSSNPPPPVPQPTTIPSQGLSLPPPPPPQQQDLNNLPMFYQYPRYSPSIQYQPPLLNESNSHGPQQQPPPPTIPHHPPPPPRRHTTQASSISPSSQHKSDISPIIKTELSGNNFPNFNPPPNQQQGQQGQGPQPTLIPQGSYTPVSSLPFSSQSNNTGSLQSGNSLPFTNFNNIPGGVGGNTSGGVQGNNVIQGNRWFGYDDNGYVGYQFGQNH